MLGTLDFAGSEHWAPFNFPYSTALRSGYCLLDDEKDFIIIIIIIIIILWNNYM